MLTDINILNSLWNSHARLGNRIHEWIQVTDHDLDIFVPLFGHVSLVGLQSSGKDTLKFMKYY